MPLMVAEDLRGFVEGRLLVVSASDLSGTGGRVMGSWKCFIEAEEGGGMVCDLMVPSRDGLLASPGADVIGVATADGAEVIGGEGIVGVGILTGLCLVGWGLGE